MKVRKGFVSNSSSSSFILAVEKDVKNEDIKIEISLTECIEKRIETIEALQAYFEKNYIWDTDEDKATKSFISRLAEEGDWCVEKYEECEQAIYNGKAIIMGSGSNEDYNAAGLAVYYGAINDLDMENVQVIESGD